MTQGVSVILKYPHSRYEDFFGRPQKTGQPGFPESHGRLVRTAQLRDYFEPHVRRVLALVAEGRGVEVLIGHKIGDTFAAEIADGLKRATFAAGLRIGPPVHVRLDCPVYRQVRQARAEAKRRQEEFATSRRIEQAVETARQEHAQQLGELLERLRTLADQSPQSDLSDLLRTFPEVDRGELYTALFSADEARVVTQAIVAKKHV